MLSWRLWQTLSEPAYKNPIFKRISKDRRFADQTKPLKMPHYMKKLIVLFMLVVIIRSPYVLLMILQIPAFVIMLIVLTPVFLPYIVMLYGAYLVSKITIDIEKEKRQYTYDLLCTSPDGALRANWLFATGIIHRGDWFYWTETLARLTYRAGQLILIGIALLTLLLLQFSEKPAYFESIQTLINCALILCIYYTSFMQIFVLILLVGIYATSLDLRQRDANIFGIIIYFILQVIPYLIAMSLIVILHLLIPNPHPVVAIGIDCIVLGSIFVTQELSITLIWHQLTKRLNATTSSYVVGQIAALHS